MIYCVHQVEGTVAIAIVNATLTATATVDQINLYPTVHIKKRMHFSYGKGFKLPQFEMQNNWN